MGKDRPNWNDAFGQAEPDPRRLDRDVPPARDHESVFECMEGFEHNTQKDADRCPGHAGE